MVLNFAAGSVKQPQQLFYLNYFHGLGQKLDLVIDIDSFNDVPGAVANWYHGFPPAMPESRLVKSFGAVASMPRPNTVILQYFSRLTRAVSWLHEMNHLIWKHLVPGC